MPYIRALEEEGHHVMALPLPLSKHYFSLKNLRAIWTTKKLLRKEQFDLISTHTTLAGIVTRLAVILAYPGAVLLKSKSTRQRPVVFHTVHGYLFHDKPSVKTWLYLLPERICAGVTDVLMVMNLEDRAIAEKYRLCKDPGNIQLIHGMGVDLEKFQDSTDRSELRKIFGIDPTAFVFVYVAEFSKRKNHQLLLAAFAQACKGFPNWRLVLAGDGILRKKMEELSQQLRFADQVQFLGYIRNARDLFVCSDVAVTPSMIEGLPFNVMEAMASGLPVIASDIKGHHDLIHHKENGLLFPSGDMDQLAEQLVQIYSDPTLRQQLGEANKEKIHNFSLTKVKPEILRLYQEVTQC